MSYELSYKKVNKVACIESIKEGSIAQQLGIKKGYLLKKINDCAVKDILDYLFLVNDEYLTLEFENNKGQVEIFEVEKEYDEELGLVFESELIDNPKNCQNNCIFCFMNQLPKKVRDTLIFKDDDYRLSFFSGNYITLTNMKESDIKRIIDYRISPINISIHATNEKVRCQMLNNRFAGKVLSYLDTLYENNITMNMQIVLCKDINDKQILEETLQYLEQYIPVLRCISIVPVGLTKYRENLPLLQPFSKEDCLQVVNQVQRFQKMWKKKYKENYVYLADEFYLKADVKFPRYTEYGAFENIENGIGMIADFEHEFEKEIKKIDKKLPSISFQANYSFVLLTGKITEKYMKEKAEILERKINDIAEKNIVTIKVLGIENTFFGDQITVTGLMVGKDILEQTKQMDKHDIMILPNVCLKQDEDIFLDDVTLEEIIKNHPNLLVSDSTAKGLINEIIRCIKGEKNEISN